MVIQAMYSGRNPADVSNFDLWLGKRGDLTSTLLCVDAIREPSSESV